MKELPVSKRAAPAASRRAAPRGAAPAGVCQVGVARAAVFPAEEVRALAVQAG